MGKADERREPDPISEGVGSIQNRNRLALGGDLREEEVVVFK